MIKAVIFDVDGTLLNTERIYMQAWKQAGKAAGFDISDDVLLRTRAIQRSDAMKIFQDALGPTFRYEAVQPIRTEIAEALIAASDDLLMPGVTQTLEYLHNHGFPIAVASSTSREKTVSHLAHAGLLQYFDAVVGGDMVQKGKPNPDILLKAAQLLGVDPQDCMVVEDTPAGIRAAVSANIKAVLIPDCVKPDHELKARCYAVLETMHQLIPLIIKENQA